VRYCVLRKGSGNSHDFFFEITPGKSYLRSNNRKKENNEGKDMKGKRREKTRPRPLTTLRPLNVKVLLLCRCQKKGNHRGDAEVTR